MPARKIVAMCDCCNLDMADKATLDCPANRTVTYPNGEVLPALPYRPMFPYGQSYPKWRCPDCGVMNGNYHHLGCANEDCPKCQTQLLTCTCFDSFMAWATSATHSPHIRPTRPIIV